MLPSSLKTPSWANDYIFTTADSHRWGISHYRALHGCIHRLSCVGDDGDGGPDADFGTVCHSYLAAYHTPGMELPTLSEEIPQGAYVSPAELMRRYSRRFTPSGLGTPLLVETRLTMYVEMPEGMRREPFVGTLDRVARFDADECEFLAQERGIMIEPGAWLIDWKTKTKRDRTMISKFLRDPQFTGYTQLWEANGGEPLKGTICGIIIRYAEDRDDGFVNLIIPPPDEDAILRWKSIIASGAEKLRTLGAEWKDATRCYEWGRECPCLMDGCNQHNFLDVYL